MAVEVDLLGDVVVHRDGQQVKVGHARQQCVLAVLAVEIGRPVSLDQLAERVWADDLPAKPRDALHGYLYRLRQVLGDAAIVRKSGGYELIAAVDVHRFADLVGAGSYDEALALWRGEPFSGLRSEWLDGVRDRLVREKHVAETERVEVALREGRAAEVVPELVSRAVEHPLDERVAGQLMVALHRSGRTAEALESYERLRRTLSDELGTDPSAVLRDLHQRILTENEPSGMSLPDVPAPVPAVPVPAASVPAAAVPSAGSSSALLSRRRTVVVLAAAAVIAVTVAAVLLNGHGTPSASRQQNGPAESSAPVVAAEKYAARLKVGDLCVSEGRGRETQSSRAIAVQRPCDGAEPPRTLIESRGGDVRRIWWDHPVHGPGCLTVVDASAAAGAQLEPWEDCRDDRMFQLFRFESVAEGRYRVRPLHADLCVGVQEPLAPGAEMVLEDCTGGADQVFVVEKV